MSQRTLVPREYRHEHTKHNSTGRSRQIFLAHTVSFGGDISGSAVATWGVDQAVSAFALGFTLAAPFLIAALLYNVALGIINRAMPQLMVAFVGAPAIVGLTLVMLALAAPVILLVWTGRLDQVLAAPLELRR